MNMLLPLLLMGEDEAEDVAEDDQGGRRKRSNYEGSGDESSGDYSGDGILEIDFIEPVKMDFVDFRAKKWYAFKGRHHR